MRGSSAISSQCPPRPAPLLYGRDHEFSLTYFPKAELSFEEIDILAETPP
ncbi:hypothetical protein AB0M12_23740 [Nocardia vinacea]